MEKKKLKIGRYTKTGKIETSCTVHRKNGTSIRVYFVRKTETELLDIKAKLRLLGLVDNDVVDVKVNEFTNEIMIIRRGQSRASIGLSKDVLVEEYVDFYLYEHRRNGINGKKIEDTTFSTYIERGNIIKRDLGKIRMVDLTYDDLDNFINVKNVNLVDTTRKQLRDMVTNMMHFANKDRVVEENILKDNKITIKEKKGKKEKKTIQEKDLKIFIDYCEEHGYYDLIFLLNTRSES